MSDAQPWTALWASDVEETEEGREFILYCNDGYIRHFVENPYHWHPSTGILPTIKREYIPNWTTKEGEEIKVSEMSDRHFQNTVAFLRRRIGSNLPSSRKYQLGLFWLAVLEKDSRFTEKTEHEKIPSTQQTKLTRSNT